MVMMPPSFSSTASSRSTSIRKRICQSFLLLAIFLVYGIYILQDDEEHRFPHLFNNRDHEYEIPLYDIEFQTSLTATDLGDDHSTKASSSSSGSVIPQVLVDRGVYQPQQDFVNSKGVSPPYWIRTSHNTTTTRKENTKNHLPPLNLQSWGPCYPPDHHNTKMEWSLSTATVSVNSSGVTSIQPKQYHYRHKARNNAPMSAFESVAGGCRPGFLIIGAGKCGTSSLYHYLTGHPRVAPAFSKQIHYFKYHLNKPLGWYYSWFPTTQSYLESGTLLTGEASPGYLPYPDVIRAVYRLMPGPKIIMVGRNPLERMYSSYKYNYVQPTLAALQAGKIAGIPKGQSDEDYIANNLFTLEELVEAEIQQLQKCLYGFGPNATKLKWYKKKWFRSEFDKREKDDNMDPLIDLDEICYGKSVNRTVLREQWSTLQMSNPHKVILDRNTFLTQAMIGRSLYVLPLEWWYILFDSSDIKFVCTEELSNSTVIGDLALSLGLPEYNFTDVISVGAYNVGDHRGYDTATTWDEVQNGTATSETTLSSSAKQIEETNQNKEEHGSSADDGDGIPLSPELRKQVLDFIQPFNERLFTLTGKRCNWY